jgi:D-alanyl-D-alanine carboxypeptidase
MRIAGAGASRRLRWGLFSLVATIAVSAVTSDPADARTRRKRVVHHRAAVHHSSAASSYSPPYSDIVLDVNSGAVLHASSPDSPRHPASLTKIMTLYLLFERLESGKFRLDTPLNVSAHAAMQAPSKLGVKPGQTIAVEDAIKAIVTRSANDVAVVVAEAIGGDEDNFATVMTRKARALGMSRTTYVNASGLPADDQITTARDQALLGRAIQDRFPRYYPYFQTTAFRYRGNVIGNHNHLLGRVAGVDGIKTGYTRASGFNLVTSVRRNNRQLVAVVLGGRSAGSRDARMQELINENIAVASVKRTAPMVAEVAAEPAPAAPRNPVQRVMAAVITPAKADPAPTAAIPTQRTAPGSNDPLQPIMVRTVSVKPAAIRTASLGPLPASATLASASAQVAVAPVKAAAPEVARADLDVPPPARAGTLGTLPVRVASAAAQMPAAAESPAASHAAHRDGWMIQIGAFDRETEAKQRLSAAQDRARALLGTADPFTERVVKGDKALYRARFAGLDKDKAEAACQYLKRNEIVCMTIKN